MNLVSPIYGQRFRIGPKKKKGPAKRQTRNTSNMAEQELYRQGKLTLLKSKPTETIVSTREVIEQVQQWQGNQGKPGQITEEEKQKLFAQVGVPEANVWQRSKPR